MKQKRAIAENATNGHSTTNTPVQTPIQTPSPSSEESASDSEKETVRPAGWLYWSNFLGFSREY